MPKKRKPSSKMKAKGMTCTEGTCNLPVHCKGLCKPHYGYLMRDRKKEAQGLLPVRYEKRDKYCKRDFCLERTIAKNLCRRHYYQQRALILEKAVPCREEGCPENAVPSSYLCFGHKNALAKTYKEAMLTEAQVMREALLRVYPDEPRDVRVIVEPLIAKKRISFIKFGADVTAVETDRLEYMVPLIDRILANKGYVPARLSYQWSPAGDGVHHVLNNLHVVERFTIQNV